PWARSTSTACGKGSAPPTDDPTGVCPMTVPFRIDLSGKVAVVTGGGGVLCSRMARALAECGAKVAVLDLRLEAAEAVAGALRADGLGARGFRADVLERPALEAAAEAVRAAFGPCDLLLNGAG